MKSMSSSANGGSRLNCVRRCRSGLRSATRPGFHIFAGENMCIHAATPMLDEAATSAEATCRASSSTRRRTDSPYISWLPVTNHSSNSPSGFMVSRRLDGCRHGCEDRDAERSQANLSLLVGTGDEVAAPPVRRDESLLVSVVEQHEERLAVALQGHGLGPVGKLGRCEPGS